MISANIRSSKMYQVIASDESDEPVKIKAISEPFNSICLAEKFEKLSSFTSSITKNW